MAKQLVSTAQYTLVDVGDYTSTGVLPPKNPVANQSIWIDTSQTPPLQKIWNGTAWVVVNDVNLLTSQSVIPYQGNPISLDSEGFYTANTGPYGGVTLSKAIIEAGKNYIISFEYKTTDNNGWYTIGAPGSVGPYKYGSNVPLNLITDGIVRIKTIQFKATQNEEISFSPLRELSTGSVKYRNVKIEFDRDAQITAVQTYATNVNNLITDIASDSKITPSEKISLKREYDVIVAEKPTVVEQATPYAVSVAAFNTAYNDLVTYVSPLVANLATTSDVNGTILRSRFAVYYSEKMKILKEISVKVTGQFATVNGQIAGVQTSLSNFQTEVNGAFKDGIISQAEAIAIEKYKNQINTEKDGLQNQYNVVYANDFLTGTPKSDLLAAWNNYVIAHTNLLNSINTAIADGKTTVTEKQDVDVKFTLYRNSLASLSTRLQEALKVIDKAAIDGIQIGTVNILRNSKLFALTQNDAGLGASVLRTDEVDHYYRATPAVGKAVSIYGIYATLEAGKDYISGMWIRHNHSVAQSILFQRTGSTGAAVSTMIEPNKWVFIKSGVLKGAGAGWAGVASSVPSTYLDYKKIILVKGNKLGDDWMPNPEDVAADIADSKTAAEAAAKLYADAQDNAKETTTKAYADGKITAAEQRSITDATNKAEAAKTYAAAQDTLLKTQVNAYTDGKITVEEQARIQAAQNAVAQAKTYSDAQDNLAKIAAAAYTDGKITTEEARAIADATAKMNAAKAHADAAVNNIQIGGRNYYVLTGLPEASGDYVKKILQLEPNTPYMVSTTIPKVSDVQTNCWSVGGSTISESSALNGVFIDRPLKVISDSLGNITVSFRDSYRANIINGISKIWVTKGNKATDWSATPEDVQAEIDAANQLAATAKAQAQNAQNTAAALQGKTSFLTTDINGNVVSTGTVAVGDVVGANAGMTGVTDRVNKSVRFWAGATYAGRNTANWLMRDDGVEERWITYNGTRVLIQREGSIGFNYFNELYNPDGQIAKRTSIVNGKVLDEWFDDGVLYYSQGQTGINYINGSPETWTPIDLRKANVQVLPPLNGSELSYNEKQLFVPVIRPYVCFTPASNNYAMNGSTLTAWIYSAGQSVYSEGYRQYEGYKTANQVRNTNIADGWYFAKSPSLMQEALFNSPVMAVFYIQGGKMISSQDIILPAHNPPQTVYSPCT